MAKSFTILKDKLSDTSKASIQELVKAALEEMPLAELPFSIFKDEPKKDNLSWVFLF